MLAAQWLWALFAPLGGVPRAQLELIVREKHAWECADEVEAKDDVDEAVRWLEFHKEKDFGIAKGLKEKKAAGDEVEVVEESDHDDDEEERLMNEY